MIETITRFALLGSRNYINGATLLEGFIAALESTGGRRITIARLKFQKIARSNGRMVLDTQAIPDSQLAHCVLSARVDGVDWRGAFFEEDRPAERTKGPAYSVADLKADRFSGECEISPAGRSALIADIVQANKRIHELTVGCAPPPPVRFGYLESWSAPPPDVAVRGKLTATNLITKKTDSGFLTVNRITYPAPEAGAQASLVLCFDAGATAASAPL